MKKIYTLLFLTTNVVSTLCMNEQPQPRKQTQQKQPLFSLSPYSNENQNTVPIYITANEPGWQQYNQIMNAPYISNTPMTHNPIDLMPIYIAKEPEHQTLPTKKQIIDDIQTFLIQTSEHTAQIKKEIDDREEKILQSIAERNKLIYSINKQLNPDLMQKLYNEAYTFVWNNWKSHSIKSNDLQKQKLINLIKTNLHAYNNGINEDIMGQFTYDQWGFYISHDYTPLIFNCLKQYRLTATKTQECLPDDINDQIKEKTPITPLNEDLVKALGITNIKHIASTQQPAQQTSTNIYPAYKELIENLTHLLNLQHSPIKLLIACLYNQHKNISEEPSSRGEYTDLVNDFHHKAHEVLTTISHPDAINSDNPINNLYDLICMVDKAKKANDLQHAKNLGYSILNCPRTNFLTRLIYKEKIISYSNNIISLTCILIDRYNEARNNKITPAPQQYHCYQMQKRLNLALPDAFDKRIFDNNVYALEEFSELFENIERLRKHPTTEDIQQLVDELYPERK